ncbi:MAG: IS66 family insertion sequence element accessory protein TnpA [Polyangiales bacterium]
MSTPTAQTRAMWTERVRAWRASGQEAAEFSAGRDFAPSTLLHWSKRFNRESSPRFARLVSKVMPVSSPAPAPARAPAPVVAPESAPSSAPASPAACLILEVGDVRVRVERGFDPTLLAEVVRALGVAVR